LQYNAELDESMGRPREFDIEKALDTAGELFWRKGYEGTSLSDLTGAIGITPPSFYFAFKSKEALFKQVVDRYQCVIAGEPWRGSSTTEACRSVSGWTRRRRALML
jgi:hypothetical protein